MSDSTAFITVMEYDTGEPVIINVSSINEIRRGDWGTSIIHYRFLDKPKRLKVRERHETVLERINAVTQQKTQ